jgi:hypothetical protein
MKLIIKILALALLVFCASLNAAAPVCKLDSSGSPYCQYSGKVKRVYINSGGLILIYFDTDLNLNEANDIGLSPSYGNATAFQLSDNPDFAKLFYSTALSAQATGRSVTVQMRRIKSGYLQFDRIWLSK